MPNLINSMMNAAAKEMLNSNPKMKAVANMFDMARRSGNPQAFVANIMRQNPQLANQLNQMLNGQDAKALAMNLAKNSGVDPNALEQMVNKY